MSFLLLLCVIFLFFIFPLRVTWKYFVAYRFSPSCTLQLGLGESLLSNSVCGLDVGCSCVVSFILFSEVI